MRILYTLLFLVLTAFVAWPYVDLFRLDRALMENNQEVLEAIVDLDAVRKAHKASLERQVNQTVGQGNAVSDILRRGAKWLGENAVNTVIDLNWVREALRWRRDGPPDAYPSIISETSFAFFESPSRFLVRIGDLGQHPIHVRMALEDWHWRVVGIYD